MYIRSTNDHGTTPPPVITSPRYEVKWLLKQRYHRTLGLHRQFRIVRNTLRKRHRRKVGKCPNNINGYLIHTEITLLKQQKYIYQIYQGD